MSWVYIIGARDGNAVKVGRGHPLRRLYSLQVGNPEKLDVLAKQRMSRQDAIRIESRIHNGLHAHHLIGEWFRRSEQVNQFLGVFRRARKQDLGIYLARLGREMSCDLCHLPIALTAPLEELTRCGSCADTARATGERLRAAKVAARERREHQRDAHLPEMPADVRYLDYVGASSYFGGAVLGRRFIEREIEEGRLQATRFRGSAAWWFLPEWLDAWAMARSWWPAA